jgi:hypothetical protein
VARPTGSGLSRALLYYNARLVVINSYWLFVMPLVASQLIIFWYMAMQSLLGGKAAFVARTTESAAPLFAAFLCAHVLAPEYRHRLEDLVFSRPVAFARTVLARLATMYVFLAAVIALMLFVYRIGLHAEYPLRTVVLAGLPSVFFLSMLSLAVAAIWHSPGAGVGVATAVWAGDALLGAQLNPLLSMHSYTTSLEGLESAGPDWVTSKLVLCAAGLALAWVAGRAVGRPPSPVKWRVLSRAAVAAVLALALYVASGAIYKVRQLTVLESNPKTLSTLRATHRSAFAVYGRVPVAYLFGGSYAHYIGYPVLPGEVLATELTKHRQRLVDQLRIAAFSYPDSRWADHALYELIRISGAIVDEKMALKGGSPDEKVDRRLAVEYCHQFLRDYPTSPYGPLVAERLYRIMAAMGKEQETQAAFETLVTNYPGDRATTAAALDYMSRDASRGRLAEAEKVAAAVLRAGSDASDPEALTRMGDFLRGHSSRDLARKAYEQALVALRADKAELGQTADPNSDSRTDARTLAARGRLRQIAAQAQAGLDQLNAPPPAPPVAAHPEAHPQGAGPGHGPGGAAPPPRRRP